MKDDYRSQLDAAKFWIEAARRLGLDKLESDLTDPKAFDDTVQRLCAPAREGASIRRVSPSPMLPRFLYAFEHDLAAFIDDHIDQKLDAEGEQLATLLIDSWPGLPTLINELKAIERDYVNSPHYHRMLDLIREWDFEASREENVARHHLRMSAPKTQQ
jgi:hypothetical protein